ncbi:MAG: glucuronate isomerase [Clostridia bacterium]|nr:glucuronate isomerase [Clostridia bacterium]
MKSFMDRDFLLDTEAAKKIFFEGAENKPIFDWHCHLSPKEIYENRQPEDIAELWLAGDHYKWRAMRNCGVDEKYITGDASGYEKFKEYARIMPLLIGNPLYHWSHLELKRYFGIEETLSEKTADVIWEKANAAIKAGGFTPRELIEKSNVVCLCTTDDPADSLEYHRLIAADEGFKTKVYPAFRPDKAFGIEKPGFLQWLTQLEQVSGMTVQSFDELVEVLKTRIAFFAKMGCRASDHSFSYAPYAPADKAEINEIFRKAESGKGALLSQEECDKYMTALLKSLAAEYAKYGWVMEIHLGAMRNNNAKMFSSIGPDTGFDSIGDWSTAYTLSRLLDSLDKDGKLPKTVLFCLNPKDNYVLSSMIGNFQSSEAAGKIQFGSAWWFNDHIDGMKEQMKTLANTASLGCFIGMVTDSRSFLSYPRHEYFRRILCSIMGELVDKGLYPDDWDALTHIASAVSFDNAKKYFGI